jgi:translation initiation factor IF-3
MSRQDAIARAFNEDKDLVLITDKAKPPVAKIIEFSKYKFQLSQKKADERKKNRLKDTKEIRLRPFIDENDLQAKLRKANDFIKRGHKVKLCLEMRGRAITKQDLAREILARFVRELDEIASVETEAKLLGKRLQLQLQPKKKSS